MDYDSGAMLTTVVRRSSVTGPGREQRRSTREREPVEARAKIERQRVESHASFEFDRIPDSRNAPTQPYSVISAPTAAITLLTPRTQVQHAQTQQAQIHGQQVQQLKVETGLTADGSSLRFLMIGLALGVIIAFLFSGHNLVRLRTSIALAIMPAASLEQLQQPQQATDGNVAPPQVYAAATSPTPMQVVQPAPQATQFQPSQFQPVARTTPASSGFPIPEVDVAHLPKHAAAPRQASRPRSGGSKAAAPSSDEAAPFDARTIEASLKE